MKHHIATLAMIAVIGSTNAFALNMDECIATAMATKYVAEQRDNGTPELVVVYNTRARFNVVSETALHNMVQSVYAAPLLNPDAIYRRTLRECMNMLPINTKGAI